jgi:hypothetical protein
MADAKPDQIGDVSADRAPLVQRIRLVVTALFVLGLFVQFYLAGRGAFGASSYSALRAVRAP